MNKYIEQLNSKDLSQELENIKSYALAHNVPIMVDEGLDFLLMLVKVLKPKRILEIGTAIGYSAIRMALVSEATIDTIERDQESYEIAKKNIILLNMQDRINLHLADALLFDESVLTEKYDLLFIDAAKAQYIKFFEKYTPLLNENGVVLTDNLLFHGLVTTDEEIASKNLRSLVRKINDYNHWLKENELFDTTFFAIGDGIAVSVKKCHSK